MRYKILLLFIVIYIGTTAQTSLVKFNFKEFSSIHNPVTTISKLKYIYSVNDDATMLKLFSYDILSHTKDSTQYQIPDSIEKGSFSTFSDSAFIQNFKSKRSKEEYLFYYNFMTKKTEVILLKKRESTSSTKLKKFMQGDDDSKKYCGEINKKTDEIIFTITQKENKEEVRFTFADISTAFNISKSTLNNFIEDLNFAAKDDGRNMEFMSNSTKCYIHKNKIIYVQDKLLKSIETLTFDLSNKKVTHQKINRNQVFCNKEPNGIFYSNSTFCNGNIFSTVCCRHNINLFIYDTENGTIKKHFSQDSSNDLLISNSNFLLENFENGKTDYNYDKSDFYKSITSKPLFLSVTKSNDDKYNIELGTYHIVKKITQTDFSKLISHTFLFIDDLLTYSILEGLNSLNSNTYNFVSTAKYFSLTTNKDFVFDSEATNLNKVQKINTKKASVIYYDNAYLIDGKRYEINYNNEEQLVEIIIK
ncbi:MAG: hypothetical protein NTZ59_03545 [Bacteroidetes bacterium]|nr:hypothetical protein [Bacteroidota bacterium]